MATEVVMPQMGESIAEGTITKWFKNVGDKVARDEALLEISTDKVDTEIPSPEAGILGKIIAEEGKTVEVGSVIAILVAEGEEVPESAGATAADTAGAAPVETAPTPAAAPPPPPPPVAVPAPAPVAVTATAGALPRQANGRFYSPLVRSIATAEGVGADELAAITGTGAGGRVTKNDILGYLQTRTGAPGAAPIAIPAAVAPAPAAIGPIPVPFKTAPGVDQTVPMDRMREIIAHHMVASIQTSAHVYIMTECDMTEIVEFRAKQKDAFLERTGHKLTYTPFFLKASALALRDFPYVNAQVNTQEKQITVHGDINVGMAVATPNPDGTFGLIVPVLKNADQMPLGVMATHVNDMAARARVGQLRPDEPQGGTFTVTNMGVFGSYGGLPIINQPQVGILGVGAIQKRPAVVDDEIVIRHQVLLSVGIDHRLVDGALGGQFLERIRYYLENVDSWLLH
ncbi:MAG: dihydrolipoamide acetyltransferase family protein [Planctomycetota bacterium]